MRKPHWLLTWPANLVGLITCVVIILDFFGLIHPPDWAGWLETLAIWSYVLLSFYREVYRITRAKWPLEGFWRYLYRVLRFLHLVHISEAEAIYRWHCIVAAWRREKRPQPPKGDAL